MNTVRTRHALIARAARMIQRNADCLRECHAPHGAWGAEREMQQIYDEEIRTAEALRALIVAVPEKTPPMIPEGEILLHLARVTGLRDAIHGIDATRAKELLWMFLAKVLAVMDESDVLDAEFGAQDINYADDLAVAERIYPSAEPRHG